jgi:hypothetical protein
MGVLADCMTTAHPVSSQFLDSLASTSQCRRMRRIFLYVVHIFACARSVTLFDVPPAVFVVAVATTRYDDSPTI